LAISGIAHADEKIGAFEIYDAHKDVIVLNGEIGIDTPLEFRRALSARPDAKIVLLNSPGGGVSSALIVAGDLHDKGLSTYIPKGFGCYSACSFLFFAGKERLAEGELGVHQMSGIDDVSGVQTKVSDILEALEKFDTPTEVITRMFRTPSENIYVFKPAEVDDLRINHLGPDVLAAVSPEELGFDVKVANTTTSTPDQASSQQSAPVPTATPLPNHLVPKLALYGGLDFYGNDLRSERLADVVECATACFQNTSCKAFTFNANPSLKHGPNCFLKGNVDRLEAYSDALSGMLLLSGEEAQTFEIGAIDPTQDVMARKGLNGVDFLTSPERGITSSGTCRMACIDNTSCKAFTYDSKLKQCYLKTSVGTPFTSSRLTSGIKRGASFAPIDVIELTK